LVLLSLVSQSVRSTSALGLLTPHFVFKGVHEAASLSSILSRVFHLFIQHSQRTVQMFLLIQGTHVQNIAVRVFFAGVNGTALSARTER
jgi:hypothetical protein